MVARAAQSNYSVFRKEGLLDKDEVARAHLKYDILYDLPYQNLKYWLNALLSEENQTERGLARLHADQVHVIAELYGLKDYYDNRREEIRKLCHEREAERTEKQKLIADENSSKRLKTDAADDDRDCIEMSLKFIRSLYRDCNTPKVLIANYCSKKKLDKPLYDTKKFEKYFYSALVVNGKRFKNTYLEPNSRFAEQSVALIAAKHFNLIDEEIVNNSVVISAPHERTLQNLN